MNDRSIYVKIIQLAFSERNIPKKSETFLMVSVSVCFHKINAFLKMQKHVRHVCYLLKCERRSKCCPHHIALVIPGGERFGPGSFQRKVNFRHTLRFEAKLAWNEDLAEDLC